MSPMLHAMSVVACVPTLVPSDVAVVSSSVPFSLVVSPALVVLLSREAPMGGVSAPLAS